MKKKNSVLVCVSFFAGLHVFLELFRYKDSARKRNVTLNTDNNISFVIIKLSNEPLYALPSKAGVHLHSILNCPHSFIFQIISGRVNTDKTVPIN